MRWSYLSQSDRRRAGAIYYKGAFDELRQQRHLIILMAHGRCAMNLNLRSQTILLAKVVC